MDPSHDSLPPHRAVLVGLPLPSLYGARHAWSRPDAAASLLLGATASSGRHLSFLGRRRARCALVHGLPAVLFPRARYRSRPARGPAAACFAANASAPSVSQGQVRWRCWLQYSIATVTRARTAPLAMTSSCLSCYEGGTRALQQQHDDRGDNRRMLPLARSIPASHLGTLIGPGLSQPQLRFSRAPCHATGSGVGRGRVVPVRLVHVHVRARGGATHAAGVLDSP